MSPPFAKPTKPQLKKGTPTQADRENKAPPKKATPAKPPASATPGGPPPGSPALGQAFAPPTMAQASPGPMPVPPAMQMQMQRLQGRALAQAILGGFPQAIQQPGVGPMKH